MRISWLLLVAVLTCSASSAEVEGQWQHGVSTFDTFKYGPGFEHLDYANPDAPKGGTLVLGTGLDFTSFTPFLPLGLPATGMISPGMLYDGLFVRANDEAYSVYGNLAEAVKFSHDLRTAVVRLRPEARWHDGVPVTAGDVKFTFDHVLANSASGVRAALSIIESVEVLGEREVQFRFKPIVGLNKNSFASPATYVNILPEHYWRTRDLSQTTLEPPLGSGPYRIADFEQGQFMLWQRVADYWGRDLPVHRGRHNFDFIRYDLYRDATISREAFKKGLIDYRTEGNPFLWRTGYETPARQKGWLVMRQNNFKVQAGFQTAMVFNMRRPRFADVRVREALTLAFDFEWTNRVVNDGYYARATSYFTGTMLAARGLPTGAELDLLEPFRDQLPDQVFTQPFELPKTSGHGRHRRDLLQARALFIEAGWSLRDGVMQNAEGEPFVIEFLTTSSVAKRTLLPYLDQLKRLGIAGSIRLVESSQYVSRLQQFDYDGLLTGLPYGFPPGVEIRAYFNSQVADTPNTANLAGIKSDVVDTLVSQVLDAKSEEQLIAASRALDRVLLWGYYLVPMIGIQEPRVVYWNKFGRPETDAEYVSAFPDTWWWDEVRAASIRLEEIVE